MAFKVASGDLNNEPLLKQIAAYKRPVIISTGAAFLGEVEKAIDIIRNEGNEEIAVLHCASLYPPGFEDANIRAIVTLSTAFNLPTGYSDHTPGWTVPVAAVTLGGCIIEKHITLSRTLNGADHSYALEVSEFKKMVDEIRNLEKALGDGHKRPVKDELGERVGARRSIYASGGISKGAVITEDMLKLVRHAYGLEPKDVRTIVGKKALREINAHELITWRDIEL
jgi:sialic acid synthase SpsE